MSENVKAELLKLKEKEAAQEARQPFTLPVAEGLLLGGATIEARGPIFEWTNDKDDQLIVYLRSCKSFQEIADKLGCDAYLVADRLHFLKMQRESFQNFQKFFR